MWGLKWAISVVLTFFFPLVVCFQVLFSLTLLSAKSKMLWFYPLNHWLNGISASGWSNVVFIFFLDNFIHSKNRKNKGSHCLSEHLMIFGSANCILKQSDYGFGWLIRNFPSLIWLQYGLSLSASLLSFTLIPGLARLAFLLRKWSCLVLLFRIYVQWKLINKKNQKSSVGFW